MIQSTEKDRIGETYNGRRIAVQIDRRRGAVLSFVSGRPLGLVYGTTSEIAARELRALRSWIDMADERRPTDPNAYPPHFYEGADQ